MWYDTDIFDIDPPLVSCVYFIIMSYDQGLF